MKHFFKQLSSKFFSSNDSNTSKLKYLVKEWLVPILIALVIVLFLNRFIFILVTVPTGSMENTIMPNDRLYVTKLFKTEDIKRGDIIVFDSDELDKTLVKRLIGLPGDKVEILTDGKVLINGEKLDEPYAVKSTNRYQIFEVPEKHYFFMGDNRPGSWDAREWNNPYIPEDKIVGRVVFRFFPFTRIGKVQ